MHTNSKVGGDNSFNILWRCSRSMFERDARKSRFLCMDHILETRVGTETTLFIPRHGSRLTQRAGDMCVLVNDGYSRLVDMLSENY